MVRTIITPDSSDISIKIPQEYVGKEIEVIAFTRQEGLQDESVSRKHVSFDAISIDTRGYKFNREEANARLARRSYMSYATHSLENSSLSMPM